MFKNENSLTAPAPTGTRLSRFAEACADRTMDVFGGVGLAASNAVERIDLPRHPMLDGLRIADLHADTLLWGVDPFVRRRTGHVDIPRLRDAGVGLQIFAAPTWTPLPMKTEEHALCVSCDSIDQSFALFPDEVWSALYRVKAQRKRARAMRIAARFRAMAQRLSPVFVAGDLDREDGLQVLLSLEGLHWLTPDATPEAARAEVAALYAVGYRMIAPTHRFSNGLGGASEDCGGRPGLSPTGESVVDACFEIGIAVDLAHAAPMLIHEACARARTAGRPVFVSHAGMRGAFDTPRNLDEADIRAVAATRGLIGVGVWRAAVGFDAKEPFEVKMTRIVAHWRAALGALTEPDFAAGMTARYGRYDPFEHLAIGSDFDGAVTTPFDATGLSHLLAALVEADVVPREKLALIADGNARRVLRAALTPAS